MEKLPRLCRCFRMPLKSLMTCSLFWLHSSLLHTVPKGIQIAGIPELRWHMFCKHMAALPQRLQYGVRQALLSSSFWILWSTSSTRTQLVKSSQSLLMCSQPPRPSSRWWDVSVEATVLQLDVLAGPRTYRAQTSACAALSVRLMRTLGLTCCRTVTVMIMNESIRWWWPLPLKCNDNINNSDYS